MNVYVAFIWFPSNYTMRLGTLNHDSAAPLLDFQLTSSGVDTKGI